MRKRNYTVASAIAFLLIGSVPFVAEACTAPVPPTPELPEIEIEPEFEDYDSSRDRAIYDVKIEVEVASPTSTVQCQCGLGIGSSSFPMPASFDITHAYVGLRHGPSGNFDLSSFGDFASDNSVADAAQALPGFNSGSMAFGFSQNVNSFIPPVLLPGDTLVLGFRMEFAPADFDLVNNTPIQFLAGSTQPGHLLGIFSNYQPTLLLPPIVQPAECDLNTDNNCDVDDLNDMLKKGPLNRDVAVTADNQIYDLSGDGYINMHDADLWLMSAATFNGLKSPYLYGDANLDGSVDGSDFGLWNANKFDHTKLWDEGDFNGDGVADGSDFGIWNAHKFTSAIVPEPTVNWIFGTLILAGVLVRRVW